MQKLHVLAPLALALAAGCGSSTATGPAPTTANEPAVTGPVLTGTLVGHDGAPMALAHVTVDRGEPIEVGADGSFSVPLPPTGFAKASFTGVDHGDHTIGLWLDGQPVQVEVRLGTYAAPESYDGASVLQFTTADDGSLALGSTTPMTRRADGAMEATVDATGPVAYELRGITAQSGRSMNGTDRTAFRYDGDGNYANVVEPDADGKVHIVFDPAKANPAGVATTVAFTVPDGTVARVAAVFDAIGRERAAPSPEHGVEPEQVFAEQDPVVREARIIGMFASFGDEPKRDDALVALARRVIAEVPARSPLWKMSPGTALAAADAADDRAYAEQVVEGLGDDEAAAEMLFGMMWSARLDGREDDVATYYQTMTAKFADSPLARPAKMFDPARAIRPGNRVPEFDLVSFDEPTLHFTPAFFAGKAVLIEFWATWCNPCVAEMPTMHKAYDEFGPKGFTILSINVDDSADNVRAFRAADWKMPWSHVVLEGDAAAPVKQLFEANALPTQILIGPDGTIVGVDPTLRGAGIEAALTRLLGE